MSESWDLQLWNVLGRNLPHPIEAPEHGVPDRLRLLAFDDGGLCWFLAAN